jgi:uncharacterized protein (TIGR00266 family)
MPTGNQLDYVIEGDDFQHVLVNLQPGDDVRAEPGSFMWMETGIEMDTSTGGGLMAGLKRKISGESFFITTFTNKGRDAGTVGFAGPTPGKILSVDLSRGSILCQRDAYLCSTTDAEISMAFTKRLGAGFFGGEGFILQKISGTGLAFLHACGSIIERELAAGETLRVDTGCLVAFEGGVDYDIEMVKGVKSMLFGGEGLFFARLKGPGTVWIQSMPFSRMADRVMSAARGSKGEHKRGGNLIGGILGGDWDS